LVKFTFTCIHLPDAFIQSDLQMRTTTEGIHAKMFHGFNRDNRVKL